MASRVEQRTIDIIPHDERHGRARDLFTIWFGSNVTPLTIVTGALAPLVYGLDFWSSVIAIALGNFGGGLLMALHSVQGPKLGVPQMIQSRGQFGAVGSVIVVMIAVIMYLGFFASSLALSGETLNLMSADVSSNTGQVLSAAISLVVLIVGYRLIHTLNRYSSIILGVLMAIGMLWIIFDGVPGDFFSKGAYSNGTFLGMVSIGATWQIAYAPYVSDYSRYMPAQDSARPTFYASYWGCTLGSIIPMVWGVMATLAVPDAPDAIVGIHGGLGSIGWLFMLLFFLAASQGNAINLYGGSLCSITVIQTFATRWLPKAPVRMGIGAIFLALSLYLSLSITSFLSSYFQFVLIMEYLLIPWTAINLVDFYLIRRGKYHVESFFHETGGIYGRYNWVAIGAYAIGVLAESPFANPSSKWKGWFVDSLNGADVAWIVGILVTVPVYYLLARATKQHLPPEGLPAEALS